MSTVKIVRSFTVDDEGHVSTITSDNDILAADDYLNDELYQAAKEELVVHLTRAFTNIHGVKVYVTLIETETKNG